MNWNPLRWVPLIYFFSKVFFWTNNFFFRNKKKFSKEQLLFNFLCIVKQKKKFGVIRKFLKKKKFQNFSDHSKIFFCCTIHKKLNKSCSLKKFFLFLKKNVVSIKKIFLKFYEVRSERWDFNLCWFWVS